MEKPLLVKIPPQFGSPGIGFRTTGKFGIINLFTADFTQGGCSNRPFNDFSSASIPRREYQFSIILKLELITINKNFTLRLTLKEGLRELGNGLF